MQPTLKKVHSVDYAGAQQQQQQQSIQTPNHRNLMHSVSIVVELAKEHHQTKMEQEDDESESADLSRIIGMNQSGGSHFRLESEHLESSSSGSDEDVDEDDDDDEDEDGECLSSDLARKVVIVDEADKILWTRAQSAEPRLWLATNKDTSAQPSSAPPPPPSPLQQPQRMARPRLSSLATCSGANWINLSASSGSSSELAERGELGKLSMRRNTHHQVNLNSFLSQQQARIGSQAPKVSSPARSGSAQLDYGGLFDSKFSLPNKNLIQSTKNKNWSQRRQSLQISLLSGIACLPSKSLTEEELRGEREFNEQVRLAKSSDLNNNNNNNNNNTPQATPVKQSAQSSLPVSSGEEFKQLRQSSKSYTSTTTNNQHHFNLVKSQQHKQQQQSAQRRVSFSSIDPILVQSDTTRSRASFALCPSEEFEEKRFSGDVFGSAFETTNYLSSSGEILERSSRTGSCMKRDHQKRHSLAYTSTILSNSTLANQRKLSSESIEEDKLVESELKHKSRYSRRNNSCASSASIFTTESMGTPTKPGIKMNDNSDNIAESRLETTVKTRMSTFSTTLGGSQDSQDPTITSSIPNTQVSVGTHEKDQSKVQSIMANAKLRQEEFARLLEEHEQIVNEINRVETKMSSSQTNLQQQQQQQQQETKY